MPKKKETQASKAEAFQSALAGLAEAKGITVEAVLDALHDALERAYIKYLDQGDDVRVKVDIDQATGKEYPPWTLDDERTIIHNAVPLLRSVKANPTINQQLVSCLRVA